MNDMVERAAKAIWVTCAVGRDREWNTRRENFKDETRAEARAGLLAALDHNDIALHVAIKAAWESAEREGASPTNAVIAALREHVSATAQSEKDSAQ